MIGSIHLPDQSERKPILGEVIAVGMGERSKDGKFIPMTLQVGDKIIFGQFAGTEVLVNGEKHTVMKEEHVLGVVTGKIGFVRAA